MLDYSKSFIETQFPVSKVSKESYKERKANLGQTLTGLGKWWGRKPLILVRAILLGVIMPVSDDLGKDREIFLKVLTMDNEGLWLRKSKAISTKAIFSQLNPKEKMQYFDSTSTIDNPKYISGIKKETKEYLQKIVFNRLSYNEKLEYCERPEHVKLDNIETWNEINSHLETNAFSLEELVKQLGEKRYEHIPKVGDCFAGGGSIPFESARIGADVYASDLNPVSALLTWASLNIAGASDDEIDKLREFQEKIYNEVDKQILEWGIETNDDGDRGNSYLYCLETACPECGYRVPLLPTFVIGKGTKTIVNLFENEETMDYSFKIIENASKAEVEEASKNGTIVKYKLVCPHCQKETPIPSIRRDNDDGITRPYRYNTPNNLRKWGKLDFTFRKDDIYNERLYCIRYIHRYYDESGKEKTNRYYVAPSKQDIERENKVIDILNSNFQEWQNKGFIPSDTIEPGWNTNQLTYERGWQYWHQLFNPRQILIHALFIKAVNENAKSKEEIVAGILGLNKLCDWDSRLSVWDSYAGCEIIKNTFMNQAFNTPFNYGSRGMDSIYTAWMYNINNTRISANKEVKLLDARNIEKKVDIWITDPPYADAVNYHELSDFFISWDKVLIEKAFPEWYTDSKRVLAVKGTGATFNESMIEIYRNLAKHMTDNGAQVVMFTHQDVKVWSELAMILWSSGLRVASAWNIATETESGGLKSGNYVKGTVLLTLKKQISNEIVFQDELYDEIKSEVEQIIDSMHDLDDKDERDFTDADYLLSSYAASLKVLTAYKEIDGIDVQYWLNQPRNSEEENPIESLINKAVKIAYDYLIPEGFDKNRWRDLTPDERFFIRALEIEMNGNYQISSYQELARGFGVRDYTEMFAEFKANSARLMTPAEFKMKKLGNGGFSSSIVRHLLVAINECTNSKSTVEGISYLKTAFPDNNEFWFKKSIIIEILEFISKLQYVESMTHWHEHAYFAKILKEALKNEGV